MIRGAVNYANQSDAVIVPTASAKKIIESWGMKNIHTAVVATGVENIFQGDANGTAVRRDLGIKDDALVLFTGLGRALW